MSLKRATGFLAAGMLVAAAPAATAPGNGRLAYSAGGSIYSVNPDGTAPAFVHGGAFPVFSPDGTRIVFADTPITPAGGLTIWVADADGSNARQIGTSFNPWRFSWSPDGTKIAFISGDAQSGFSVVVLNSDGSIAITASADASPDAPPSWSPDGTELAFTTTNNTDIAVAKADGGGRRLLIQDATRDTSPSWSPDGSQIAFFRDAFGRFVLYVIGANGNGLRQVSPTQARWNSPPAWSPDGSRLAFEGSEPVGYYRYGPYFRENVYTVGADGVGERRLTDSASFGAGSAPLWSPDGHRIAFLSSRPGYSAGSQLFVMNQDGTCETQLTSLTTSVSWLSWQALATGGQTDPLKCAALSITGSLGVVRDRPALDDSRVYVYHGFVSNNGNVTSDPLRLVTADESPFFYISANVTNSVCTLGARVSCTLPALPPGGTVDVEFRFNAFVAGTFELEPKVEATGSTPDGDTSDNADEQYRTFPFCEISTQHGSTLHAGGDDDLICGTVGPDVIFAGGGSDRVFGGDGRNVIHAGPGDDQVQGGGGTDVVYGDSGRDRIHGSYRDDVLIGGGGPDLLWGDDGGDFLRGGPGADRFFGGPGNDVIDSRDGITEHVYCGDGTDRVEADLRDIVQNCEKVVRRPAKSPRP
jgi:Tol biopolymer transport system component